MPILDSLADRFPEHPYIQNLLGVAFVQRDKNEAALGRFERALELSPPDCRALRADVLANIGGTRVKLGQLESAERDYFRALEYDSNSGGTFANLGNIRLIQQRYHEAIEFFYTAFELGLQYRPLPNYVTGSVLGMGRCFRIIGEESAASMMLEIVRKLPPEHMYLIQDTLDSDEREESFYNRDLERRT